MTEIKFNRYASETILQKKSKAKKLTAILSHSWLVQLCVITICIVGTYLMWLGFQIRKEFNGKKWSIPARVYASSKDLRPDIKLTINELE